MENYHILGRIGEGAHGIVFKAKHIQTGELVALKKVPLRKLEDGIPTAALREIKALQESEENHHVVRLHEVFPSGAGFVLVFDYMLSDLSSVLRNCDSPLTEDLKPANLLISQSGHLKIADFGLARVFSKEPARQYSHQVATRWYRAPELLYGARHYDPGVDLWAVGCIFGELLNNSPLFPGESDIEQLYCVLHVLGTPNETVWPGVTDLPDYNKIMFSEMPPIPLEEIVPDASPTALELLKKFLVYPSKQRISAAEALVHPYFFVWPLPAHHSELPIPNRQLHHGAAAHKDFNIDEPLQHSLVKPDMLAKIVQHRNLYHK